MGSKIESIGDYAFIYPNSNLNTLKIDTVSPPKIGRNFFEFGYDTTSMMNCILVPRGSVSDYKNAWTSYAECIYSLAEEDTFYRATYSDGTKGWNFSSEGTNGILTERMVQASYGGQSKDSITDVYLSNEVTSIDRYAFYYCRSLTSITIPNSVKLIDSYAFGFCSGLTRIDIGSGVTKIGDMAFYDVIKHFGSDDDYHPSESDIVVYCYATTPPEVRIGDMISHPKNSPFVYDGNIMNNNGNTDYLYKPVVYVPCSSLAAYKASNWNDICVLKPIEDDCAET